MELRRWRWLCGGAVAALSVLAAVLLWRAAGYAEPPGRIELLRGAFDQASGECYDSYRGPELQACLAGVMEAHLHALGGGDEPDEDDMARAAPSNRL